MKAKQDQEYKDRPLDLSKAYRNRVKERLHVREGEHWRPKDLKAKGLLNFRGFKTLERWYEVQEEMGELLDANDMAHAKALNALTMTMVEEVAAGGDGVWHACEAESTSPPLRAPSGRAPHARHSAHRTRGGSTR